MRRRRFLHGTVMLPLAVPVAWQMRASAAQVVDAQVARRPAMLHSPDGERYADATRQFQGIPGIETAGNGMLWATWYGGGTGEGPLNYVLVSRSMNNGRSWQTQFVLDPPEPVRAFDPCLWMDPSGRLWLFWAQSAGLWDGRGGVWGMVLGNPTAAEPKWSAPRWLMDGVMMNKPTVTTAGDWLLPVAAWRFKPPVIREHLEKIGFSNAVEAAKRLAYDNYSKGGSGVYISRDHGKSFAFLGKATVADTQHDEHMIVELRDSRLWMLVRTTYGIGESHSADGGRTWSAGGPTGIPHPVSRFAIRRLRSGTLLLVRHNSPDNKTRSHLTAYCSHDDGLTWTGGLLLDERPGVSYPDVAQDASGAIYVIYDWNRRSDQQILMTELREEDVAAGRLVSGKAQMRVLINQAGRSGIAG